MADGGGFEHIVHQVAELERRLAIHDLVQFTPEVPDARAQTR